MNLELVEWFNLEVWAGTLRGLCIFGVLLLWSSLSKVKRKRK